MSIHVRPAKPTDTAFIMDAWKRSFEGAPAVRHADREHYRTEMERTIGRVCAGSTVLVACDSSDEDTLVGFASYSARPSHHGVALHYIYVKRDFRGMGIAKRLLRDVPVTAYTFLTATARPPREWAYTPRFTI